jgi:acyl-CoA reductase-like NAD-dependent aldehyde dehydrogenase
MDHNQMARPFSKVRSAAIDGRLHSVYYRKTQLKQLFDVLVKNSQLIRHAIAEDSEHRRVEVELEFLLAVQSLKDSYNALNPERELKNEYLIANRRDSPLNREPIGIAIIEPTAHTFLYSVITAVGSAIAAGNTFILWVSRF